MKCENCGRTIPEQPENATADMLLCDNCYKVFYYSEEDKPVERKICTIDLRTSETHYRVTWEIDVWATSPEKAALMAREINLDPESTATIYSVQDDLTNQAAPIEIDTDKL